MLNCYAVVCQCRPRLLWFWLLTHLCARTTAHIDPLRYHPRYDGSGHRIDSSGRRLFVRQSVDLLRWTMNMNSGSLTLQFNAGMDVSTLNASRIIIQASRTRQPGDQYVRLTEGNTTSSSVDGQDVGVTLAKEDWYNLQRAFNVATSRETAWIVIEKGMLRDGANTESNELLNGNAMQAATFQRDYTEPRLISHDLDMNGAGFGSSVVAFLTLRFDEVVDTTTFDGRGIQLRQYPNYTFRTVNSGLQEGDSLDLTAASFTTTPNNTVVKVTLGQVDADRVKLNRNIAVDNETSSLVMKNITIRDMAGQMVRPITKEVEAYLNPYTLVVEYESAYPVVRYVADTTGPRVIFYALDINVGLLRLQFDEAIDVSTLDITKISIQQNTASTGSSHSLTSSSTTPSVNGPSLIIVLSTNDKLTIANDANLAISRSTAFISFPSSMLSDMTGNTAQEISASAARTVDRYIVVGLTEYAMDLNQDVHATDATGARESTITYGHMTFTFNGIVDVSTLDVTQVTLQYTQALGGLTIPCSGVVGDCSRYTLTTAGASLHSSTSSDGTVVRVQLTSEDLNQIKLRPLLASSDQNVFLSLGSTFVLDIPGDDITPFTDGDLLSPPMKIKAGGFTKDSTNPFLVRFDIDMNVGTLTFTFSEVVNASSLNVTQISLQNDPLAANIAVTGNQHTFGADSYTASPNGIEIVLTMSVLDLQTLKTMRSLAIDRSHTYLVMIAGAIKDMAGNPVIEVGTGLNPDNTPRRARLVSNFNKDITAPQLTGGQAGVRAVTTSFFADMERGVLILTFSEPVDPVTFNSSGVVLSNNAFGNGTVYRLGNQSFALLTDPFSRVKLLRTSAVRYMLSYVLSTNDRSVYTLDFAEGVVYNALALRLQQVLQDPIGTVEKQKMHAATSNVLAIQLSQEDRNNIMTLTDLGTSKLDTFLILDSTAIKDMAGNPVSAIVGTASGLPTPAPAPGAGAGALSTVYFNADSGRPGLDYFELDMNKGLLTMVFSEAVDAATLDVTKLTFISQDVTKSKDEGSLEKTFREEYTLNALATTQTPSLTASPPGAKVVVQLGNTDMNGLRRTKGLAKSLNTSYLLLQSGAIKDMSGFDVLPIVDATVIGRSPLKASKYIGDTTPPRLIRSKIDFPLRRLRLTFSEAVDIDTVSLPHLELQQRAKRSDDPGRWYALTDDSKAVDPTAGSYCASLYKTAGQQPSSRRPALIHGGMTCAVLDDRTGIQYELFSKGVDIDIHLGEVDAAAVLAAWPPGTVPSDISEGPPQNVFVAVKPEFVTDFAASAASSAGGRRLAAATGNQIVAVDPEAATPMASTDCTACSAPNFLWRVCGLLDDRLCSRCTVCPYNHFTIKACTATTDTECHRCSSCAYGKFVVRPCGGGVTTTEGTTALWTGYTSSAALVSDPTKVGADTLCRRCRDCNHNTFETRKCEMGLDRQCQTCDSCSLTPQQERKCRGQSWVWRRINCCKDLRDNQVKPCKDVPLENFKISASDGRRDEVWCYNFNRDKKQCEDEMYQNGEEPLGGHIDETEFFDGTSTRYKEDKKRIHLQDTNIPVQSYGDAADTNRVIPITAAPHESNVHPGRHARQQTGTQNVDTNRFFAEVADLPVTGVSDLVAETNKMKKLMAVRQRYPTPKGFNTGY